MDQSNTIAQDIEMHGVCTFSAKDMAFNMVPATSVIVYHHLLRVYPSRYLDVSSFSCKSMHPPSIRHPRPHPLTNLQTTLTANLQQIWDALVKPPELQGLQVDRLTDYNLSFPALPHPHKILVYPSRMSRRCPDSSRLTLCSSLHITSTFLQTVLHFIWKEYGTVLSCDFSRAIIVR